MFGNSISYVAFIKHAHQIQHFSSQWKGLSGENRCYSRHEPETSRFYFEKFEEITRNEKTEPTQFCERMQEN